MLLSCPHWLKHSIGKAVIELFMPAIEVSPDLQNALAPRALTFEKSNS